MGSRCVTGSFMLHEGRATVADVGRLECQLSYRMPKKPVDPPEDPNLAAFRAILARKKAARSEGPKPGPMMDKAKPQKPRPKERIRRRP